MIMENAMKALKTLDDLEYEANAVLSDPISKDMTTLSNTKDITPILATAKKNETHLHAMLVQIQKATAG